MRRNVYGKYNNKIDEIKTLIEDLVLRIITEGNVEIIDHGERPFNGKRVDIIGYDLQNGVKIIGEDSRQYKHVVESLKRLKERPCVGFHYTAKSAIYPYFLKIFIILDDGLSKILNIPVFKLRFAISNEVIYDVKHKIGRYI